MKVAIFLMATFFAAAALAQTVPLKPKPILLSVPPPASTPGRSDPAATNKPIGINSFSKNPDPASPSNPAGRVKSLSATPLPVPPTSIPNPSIMGSGISLPPAGGSSMNISPENQNTLVAPSEVYETGQVAVLWKNVEQARQGLSLLEREYQLRPISQVDLKNLGGVFAVFQLGNNPQAVALRSQLRKNFPDWAVDFNMRYHVLEGPRFYANQRIALPKKINLNVKNIRVGMLDGSVGKSRTLNSIKLVERSFLNNGDTSASQTHATNIATLLGGRDDKHFFVGVAPGITLFSGSIMRKQGNAEGTTTAYLLQGLDWLLQEKVQVINLSLGGPGDALMAHAFSIIAKKPLVIVAAAGNSGPKSSPSYPAAYPGVLAVTASDVVDQIYQKANHGSYITLAAPGVDLWIPNEHGGNYVSGTSYAAAIVTGSIALMLAQSPVVNSYLIQQTLCKTAKDIGVPGKDAIFGCGLLQVNITLSQWKDYHTKN